MDDIHPPPDKPPPKRLPGSFFQLDRAALDIGATCGPMAFLVYAAMASHADHKGECYPSIVKIAKRFGCRRERIHDALRRLMESGYIEVQNRSRVDGRKTSNLYRLKQLNTPPVGNVGKRGHSMSENGDIPMSDFGDMGMSENGDIKNETQYERDSQERDSQETNTPPNKSAGLFPEMVVPESGSKRTRKTYSQEFSQWYDIYPKHVAKGDAEKAFPKAFALIAAKHKTPAEALLWLLDRTREFASSDKGQSGQYCPNPATWLTGKRYDDKPETWKLNGNGKPATVNTKGYVHSESKEKPHGW